MIFLHGGFLCPAELALLAPFVPVAWALARAWWGRL